MKRIIILGLVVVLMASLLPLTNAAALTDYGTVVGGWLRLRAAPSFDATIIKSYYTGTVVEILGTSGDWYNVKAPDNQAGYMYAAYIDLGGGGGTTAYVTSANGYGVRLRTGPSTAYRVLAVYAVGTQVSVLQSGVIWSRIQIGTTVGYMMSEFLTTTPPGPTPTTPPSGDMATVWSSNGYGVRLRSGPGTNYSIIGLYSVGTRVAIQTRGTEWDYILVGSRLGYMMNEFLIYDHENLPVATGITIAAVHSTGMPDEYVDLDVNVTGTDLSTPAYTLAVTSGGTMAEISGDSLHILSTATVGTAIEVTATTTDDDSGGNPLTDTCTVTVIAPAPRVTSFAFDQTTATASIASGDVQLRVGYSITGLNLTSPYFSLALSPSAGGHVSTSINETTEEIVLDISSAIAVGTEFTVTGTTTADDAGGNPKTAVLTVTITDAVLTLTSIELVPEDTSLRYDETTNINCLLHYSDGSYASAAITTQYTLNITTGSTYASLGGKLLVPDAAALIGVADQTIVITGTSVADPALTDTCNVLLYGRNEPDPPTLTGADPAHESVELTWTVPTNDGGEDLTGYTAYYSFTEGGAKTPFLDVIGPAATSHTFTGLTNGTEYFFYLVATNPRGDSDYSNSVHATPNPTAPSAPQGLTVSDRGDGYVELSWSAPADTGGTGVLIDHYIVYKDHADGTNEPTTSYTWSGLTNGVSHVFTVVAVNSATSGLPAEVTSNAVGTPDAPIIGTRTAGFESITITWAAGADNGGNAIQSYDVYIKVETDPDPGAPTDTVTDTEYAFTCTTETTYEYWVIANNGYYDSAESTRETLAPTYVRPSVPQNLVATGDLPDHNQMTIAWDAPADDGGQAITYYKIVYSPTGGTPDSPIIIAAATTSQVVTGLAADTYSVSVSATNDGTNYGPAVTDASVVVTDP